MSVPRKNTPMVRALQMYKLGKRSLKNLEGVTPLLVDTVKIAITLSKVDFVVIEGLRTIERQRELVARGASQTLKSKHIEGKAVDLMAYIKDRGSWELNLYDDIADAMKAAAKQTGAKMRWGAAWTINDITQWNGTMEQAMNAYIDQRRSEGKRPFIDAPHFEIS